MNWVVSVRSTKSKTFTFGVAVLLATIIVGVIGEQSASAMFKRSPYTGFFTASYATSGDYVQPGGIGVTNAESFISWYEQKLNGSQQEKVMASFTIRTMTGQKVGTASQRTSVPSSTLDKWKGLVRQYAAAGRINFTKNHTFDKNTFYQASGDIAWYHDGPRTISSIVFSIPGGKEYAIKRDCANPVGDLTALEPLDWELEPPVTKIKKGNNDWTSRTVPVNRGDTVSVRYQVENDTKNDTTNFEHWRSMNFNEDKSLRSDWRLGSKTTSRLGGNSSLTSGVITFNVPSNAPLGREYCWRASVDPRSSSSNSTLSGERACIRVGVGNEPGPRDPSWSLTLGSAVSTPFIEQGGGAFWTHTIVNSDPTGQEGKVAKGFNRCMVFNYDRFYPNGGAISGGHCGDQYAAVIPVGNSGPYVDDEYIVQTDGGTSLGTVFCQRYSVGKQAENNPVPADSQNACTTVVGGKTRLSVNQPSAGEVEPTRPVNITADLRTEQYTTAGGYTGYGVGCQYNVTAQLPNNVTQTLAGNTPCSAHIDNNDPRGVVNYSYTPNEGDIGKRICLNVSIWPANGNENLMAAGASRTGQSCFEVVAKPYIKVAGGDIAAARCDGGGAIIAGWNKLSDDGNAGSAGNQGAGAQYAAYAQGVIRSFASGQYVAREAGYGYSPVNLSFANDSTNADAGNFGGNFGGTPCPSRYYDSSAVNAASDWPGIATAISNGGTRVYKANATATPLVIGAATIPANVNARLYVDGDVILGGDISANYAGAIDIAQIPNFTLIVKGNIYVQPNVRTLNGTFIAEGSSKGQIYTCSTSANPIRSNNFTNSRPVPAATPYATCGNQLNFIGSVVAKKIHLQRTYGSMFKDVNQATGAQWSAETFKYNPLTWMLGSTGVTSGSEDQYDSITTLPPVL